MGGKKIKIRSSFCIFTRPVSFFNLFFLITFYCSFETWNLIDPVLKPGRIKEKIEKKNLVLSGWPGQKPSNPLTFFFY